MKRLSHDEYVNKIKYLGLEIEVLETYVNMKTPILHKCTKHNVEWNSMPSNILKGRGCNMCYTEKQRKKLLKGNDEYVDELLIKNPNVESLEVYIDSRTKIMHRCKKHDVKWMVSPSNVLSGHGCEKCKIEKIKLGETKTHDDYVKELKEKNCNVEVVESYISMKTPILHHCLTHDINWKVTPANILGGHGCEKCHKERIAKALTITEEEYKIKLYEKNPTIELVGKYINMRTKTEHYCIIHDIYWMTTPDSVLSGHGCKKCLKEKIHIANSFSNDEYIKMLKEINKDIVLLEEYININTPILHKCTKHNVEWKTRPCVMLRGSGCRICASEKTANKLSRTQEEYNTELNKINPNIIAIDKYINCFTPIKHKCLIHNKEFINRPSNVLCGSGCDECKISSRGEKQIYDYLNENNIKFEQQKRFFDCKNERALPFDFYLPDYNLCIEYQGIQHFKPVEFFGGVDAYEQRIKNDKIKSEYCKNNNINLLKISYYNDVKEELDKILFI